MNQERKSMYKTVTNGHIIIKMIFFSSTNSDEVKNIFVVGLQDIKKTSELNIIYEKKV
jgi:hypothetical protein